MVNSYFILVYRLLWGLNDAIFTYPVPLNDLVLERRGQLISNFRVETTRKLDLSKINATTFVLTVLVKCPGRPPKNKTRLILSAKRENLI